MKPRFALDLSHEAVSLLERAAGGWVRIGRAQLDDPSLGDQLAGMRALAKVRAPEGFVSKLILPNSQILYFEMDAPGADQATRRAQILDALSGRTPYAVEDLVFDFSRQGDHLKVAVVARETLEEAESFAEAYGFCPAGFVAIPEANHFAGEPFFGLTSVASHHLPADTRFDRDQDPVRVIAQADAPLAALFRALPGLASSPAAPAGEVSADPEAPEATAEAEPTPASDAAAVAAQEQPASSLGVKAVDPTPDKAEAGADMGSASETLPLPDEDGPLRNPALQDATPPPESLPAEAKPDANAALASEPGFTPGADAETVPATLPADTLPTHAPDSTAVLPAAATQDDEAPFAEVSDTAEAAQGATTTDLPEQTAAPAAFHSRRAPQPDEEACDEPGARLAAILPRLGGIGAQNQRKRGFSAAPALDAPPSDAATSPRPLLPTKRLGAYDANGQLDAEAAPGLFAKRVGTYRGPRTTIFGGIRLAHVGPLASPRVQLGAAGLLAIGAIGLWAIFLSPATVPEALAPTTAPAPEATAPATAPETATAPVDLPRPDAVVQVPTEIAEPAPDADIGTNIAAEGATPEAVGATTLPQDVTLTADPPLAAQPQPQPFGTLLRFDEMGRIAATPEGVITPDGFTIVAGKPPRLPPARTARAQPVAEPNPLAGKRPRPRPANLVPASAPAPADAAVEQTTMAATALPPLATPVDPRHAARQPKARPADFLTKAAARRQADEAVADAAASAARAEAEAAAKALATASSLAVATSRQPAPRSPVAVAAAKKAEQAAAEPALQVDNTAVEAALAEAQTATGPSPELAPDPAKTEVDEPEPQEGIATLPTTRTVAKKSTLANAIDLGDINLIGVYGSSANRRALVRMPNGRFVKVQVGDRIDGGQVAAISDNELRYVKRGKTYALKMVNDG